MNVIKPVPNKHLIVVNISNSNQKYVNRTNIKPKLKWNMMVLKLKEKLEKLTKSLEISPKFYLERE